MAQEPQTPPSVAEFDAAPVSGAPSLSEFDAAPQTPPLPGKPVAPTANTGSPSTSVAGSSPAISSGSGLFDSGGDAIATPQSMAGLDALHLNPALRTTPKTAQMREDRKLFGALDLKGIEKVRHQADVVLGERGMVDQLAAKYDAESADLEFAQTDLDAKRYEAENATDPAVAQRAAAEYEQMAGAYNQRVQGLERKRVAIEDLRLGAERSMDLLRIREHEIKSQQGTGPGATWNALLEGVGTVVSGAQSPIIDVLVGLSPPGSFSNDPEEGKDAIAKRMKGVVLPQTREAPVSSAGASGTTKEFSQEMEKGFFGGAWINLARSAPAMVTPMMTGIALQTMDQAEQEMQGPQWADVPEGERNMVKLGLAIPTMLLEKFGFQSLAKNQLFGREVMASAISKLPAGASKEQIERTITSEIKDRAADYLSRVAGHGALTEAATEGIQQVTQIGTEDLYSMMKEKRMFDNPDTFGEYASEVLRAAGQGAVGAFFMAQPFAISAALKKNEVGKLTTPKQFELVEGVLRDPNYPKLMDGELERNVASGKITEVQAEEIKKDFAAARVIRDKIPDDLPTIIRREAFDILSQMEALKSKDPILVAGKMEALKERLRKLPGIESEPAKTGTDGEVKKPFTVEPTGGEVDTPSSLVSGELTNTPMPEGSTRPKGITLEPKPPTTAEEDIVSDIAGSPLSSVIGSRGVYTTPSGEVIEGDVYLDGQTLVIETADRVYEIGNARELAESGNPPVVAAPVAVSVNQDGAFVYSGTNPEITAGIIKPHGPGLKAIKRDKGGNIKKIVVTDTKGNTKSIVGQEAEDLAYYMMLGVVENNKSVITRNETVTKEIDTEYDRQTKGASKGSPDEDTQASSGGSNGGGVAEPVTNVPTQTPTPTPVPESVVIEPITPSGEALDVSPFAYQNANAEHLIGKASAVNGIADWTDNSNATRYRVENAGDILRELSKSDDGVFDPQYVYEKVNGVEKLINGLESGSLRGEDTPIGAARANPGLWDALREAYSKQPTETKAQAKALELVNAVLSGDVKKMRDAYSYFENLRGNADGLRADNVRAQQNSTAPEVVEPTTPSGEALAAGVVGDTAIEQLRAHASSSKNERRIVTRVSDGAIVIDVQGGKAEDGLSDSVEFTTDKDASAWLESGEIIDSHTHPDESSFSDGDWGTFAWSHVNEMRVVTPSGTVFTLKKTPKWDAIPWEKRTPRKIRDRWNELSNRDLTTKSVPDNIHDINEEMAEEFGIDFSSSKSLPSAEPTTEPLTIFKGVKGKIGPNGERISAHEGVEGVFGSLDQSVSEKYKGDEPLKRFDIPAGTTVGTVEVDVKGKSVDEYRAEEVKAINASPAQVVKLITLDSGKGTKQEQYVIKDKGLIESATDVVEEVPPLPPTEKPKAPIDPDETKMRATAKRLGAEHPEIAAAMTPSGINYKVIRNDVSIEAADAIIEYGGEAAAVADLLDPYSDIHPAVKAKMFLALMNRYDERGDHLSAAKVSDAFLPMVTDAAQMIQAMSDWAGRFFQPAQVIRRARERMDKRVERRAKRDKNYKKVKEAFKKVDEEVANIVSGTTSIKAKVAKASTPDSNPAPPDPKTKSTAPFGSKNKLFTKDRKNEAWKAMMSRTAGAIIQPEMVVIAGYYIEGGARSFAEVAEKVVKRGGKKLLPYLKGAYEQAAKELGVEPSTEAEIDEYIAKANTDKIVARLDKAIEKKDKKAQAKAISELQQVAKDMGLWGMYKSEAASRLKRLNEQAIKEDIATNPAVDEFTKGLVRNMTAKMKEDAAEAGKEEGAPKKARPDIEVIGDAFKNFEKYEEVWAETQNQLTARLRAAEARLSKAETPAAKEEAENAIAAEEAKLQQLDAYFGDILRKPFSDKGLGRAVKQGIKDLDKKIDDIVRQHYTVQEGFKTSLQDKLITQAGLSEDQARGLADAVGREFDRLATERKRAIIAKYLGKKAATKKSAKGPHEDVLTLSNVGAFSDAEFLAAYGKMRGWPSLTDENIAELVRLSQAVQDAPDGRPKIEATQDLFKFEQNLDGTNWWDIGSAIWYANMLSGFQTHEVNFLAGLQLFLAEAYVTGVQSVIHGKPKDLGRIAASLPYAFARGLSEGRSVLRTGYSPLREGIDKPGLFERKRFADRPIKFRGLEYDINPLNYMKYVNRVLKATDTQFFEPLKEMTAAQAALSLARSEGSNPDLSKRAQEILGRGNDVVNSAKQQAADEYVKEVEKIEAGPGTRGQKDKAINTAKLNEKRRVFELVEKARPLEMNEFAAKMASRATLNAPVQGFLGSIARGINLIRQQAPVSKFPVPFVDVIANAANETMNWGPIGIVRALTDPESSTRGLFNRMDPRLEATNKSTLTDAQRKHLRERVAIKAITGTAVMAGLILAAGGDDDDFFEITANGTGDWGKNKNLVSTRGWQPYSIRLGGEWISYQYSPLMIPLAAVGHYADAQKYRKEKIDDNWLRMWGIVVGRSMESLMDASMLGGIQGILASVTSSGEGTDDKAIKAVGKILKTAVVPALYTQTARQVEGILNIPEKEVRGDLWGYMIQDLPVFRDQDFNAVNWLGDPIIPESGFAVRFLQEAKTDPIARLIGKNDYAPSVPQPNTLTGYDPAIEKERFFNEEERAIFYKERGKFIKDAILDGIDELNGMTKKRFEEAMTSLGSHATKHAKEVILFKSSATVDGKMEEVVKFRKKRKFADPATF